MNIDSKSTFLFLGGAALGALAAYALTRENSALKPVLTDLMAGGLNLKEKFQGVVEHAKENLDDLMAEAEHARKSREATAGETKAS
ncbi:hypothetical protein [Fundidesulfovibrio agrisoli]|uniref:hypothetical protein n=1 Tax=Fundidesulfovibrio agrisoli TaxID=2922717 RepID=UPI001FAC27C5|nr:hypothetical protein [Fundidesulfovibrio agrisoli]